MKLLRALPLALLLNCGIAVRGENALLPGIFAARPLLEVAAESPVTPRRPILTSPRLSALVAEQIASRANAVSYAASPVIQRGDNPEVVLPKFMVHGEKVRVIELPEVMSPMTRFVRTGRMWEGVDGRAAVDLKVFVGPPVGRLQRREALIEIGFRFNW